MDSIRLKINGIEVEAPKGATILEAAHLADIQIPTLCFLKEINEIGACRICVVEVKGAKTLVAACMHPVSNGMEVGYNTPKVLESRRKRCNFCYLIMIENVFLASEAEIASFRICAGN